ncbi:hypothetical protein [Nostoc edaphicum]|uniref:hypothetical protein n=1 Tax=Nostoc edaphicum TaxID=264686 RepID=UPI001D146F7C|nr:hypothetical protein [Nostoc edaphicum]
MLTIPRYTRKLSLFFLFCFTLLLTFLLCLFWVSAKETPKPKPQAWQINGILTALDDGHDEVKQLAFDKFNEYDLQNLKSLFEKPEDIAQKAAKILKDKSVDSIVRSSAAEALGKIEQLNLNNIVVILDNVYYAGQSEFARWRFLTYFLGGGTEEVKTLLTWLGFPNRETIPASLNHDRGVKTLNIFAQAWEPTQGFARLREDLIQYAADTKDNTVSNTFVQLLRTR